MAKVAVFPVPETEERQGESERATYNAKRETIVCTHSPDCAWAMTSLPVRVGFTARCWMAEGFSKPYA